MKNKDELDFFTLLKQEFGGHIEMNLQTESPSKMNDGGFTLTSKGVKVSWYFNFDSYSWFYETNKRSLQDNSNQYTSRYRSRGDHIRVMAMILDRVYDIIELTTFVDNPCTIEEAYTLLAKNFHLT